ncbi:hypothetical protein [Mesorhizobium sp. M0228]|uniref:IS1096 element passenger TnpR family protein n=1 Tax=Mesorhizobium sp. M0228 TaxID=2956923 RepID=UPI00333D03D1
MFVPDRCPPVQREPSRRTASKSSAPSPLSALQTRLVLEATERCPPEDIGGPWSYQEFREACVDPTHERHAELVEWLGQQRLRSGTGQLRRAQQSCRRPGRKVGSQITPKTESPFGCGPGIHETGSRPHLIFVIDHSPHDLLSDLFVQRTNNWSSA